MINRFTISLCLIVLVACFAGCAKEYSYEGGAIPGVVSDTSSGNIPDTTNLTVLPTCTGCTLADTTTNKWSFKVGNSLLCGSVTNTVISPDGSAMTFFGPSRCSADSGLIITAYFDEGVLKTDQTRVTAKYAYLEYYDNTTNVDVLQSKPTHILTFTMLGYRKQTGTGFGIFNGWVVNKSNGPVRVDSGMFTIRF